MIARRRDLPPGPPYPPLVQGVGLWTRPLASLERWRARYGRRFTVRFPGAPPFVILSDPDEIKQVYTAPPDVLHPGAGARVLEVIVGSNSVILLDGDRHMEQRKLLLPAFHGERMERLTDLVTEIAESEIAAWPRAEEIPLQHRMQKLTLEVILRAVFGLEAGERLEALRGALGKVLTFGDRPISLIPPDPDKPLTPLLKLIGPYAEFVRLREETDAMIFDLIDDRRANGGGGDDVLAMLLEARHEDGSPMSPQELRDELMTLLVAGHETTASSLSFCFERLSRQPRVLARLVESLDDGEDDYLLATIQETLRARPVLPNTAPRLVVKPIEVGGRRYEPGVCLVPNGYLLHHDPDIYPDPYSFRPERFLESPPGTYTWIPFGGGRRRCIGASFALLEMRVVIRAILTACELRPAAGGPEPPRRRNITIRPGRGARVVLHARERSPVAA